MPWLTPVITAFRKLRQEDYKFKASLGYMARPYLKPREREREQCWKHVCEALSKIFGL
jgi:hypothetical protein